MDTNITQSPEDVKVLIITNIAVNADQINPQISTSATAMFCGAFDTCGAGKGGGGGERVRGLSENSERREGRRKGTSFHVRFLAITRTILFDQRNGRLTL